MNRLLSSAVLLSVLLSSPTARGEGPFASLSFDQALKRAASEKKLVFVDFYATWCMPCKMLDATTFKDAKVVDFLSKKVVAVKIDAEKHE
ncbi:MAG: DUF255 domain-containing protein, partial [bacterium]|nr:DUF255 domain-containing protein [bacterium]